MAKINANYEAVYILDPSLNEEQIASLVEKFKKVVFRPCGNVKFIMAELGNDAGAYGAWKLALDAFGER